ncbi:B3 DNA binding domain containing protein, partial [Trema orientale]
MPSGPREDSNKPTFSSRNPHFFKIILEDTLRENKLRVPKDFVKKCGKTLSNSVSVKLPCGSEWKMKLTEYDNKVWLDNGWPEFVEHYSIGRGNLLTFRYEGNSQFHVVVFDTTTVEIDYPSGPIHFDESNIDGKLREPKREVISDDFVEFVDDCSPCRKTRVKSSLPCSPPSKRMKASPTGKTQSNLSRPGAKWSHRDGTFVQNRMGRGNSKNSEPDMKGKHDLLATSYGDKSRQKTSKILGRMKPFKGNEKYAALLKASGFKSRRPFFKILMQPSYVHGSRLTIPPNFAERYIKRKSRNVILKVLDGRTWPVRYTLGVYDRLKTARFRSGWKEFVRNNNIEVGDVCVFVLLEGIKIEFEVIIFRVNGNSKNPMSQAHKGGAILEEPEQSLTNETTSSATVNDE